LNVKKIGENSNCDSSSCFSSSKCVCSLVWCLFFLQWKSIMIRTSQRKAKHHLHIQETNNFKKWKWKRCEGCVLHDPSCPYDVCLFILWKWPNPHRSLLLKS
jgi:hypothetical protein